MKKIISSATLIGVGLLIGGVVAITISASADTTTPVIPTATDTITVVPTVTPAPTINGSNAEHGEDGEHSEDGNDDEDGEVQD